MADIHALEDTLKLVEFVAVKVIKAKLAGTPLFDFVSSPEFQGMVAKEVADIPDLAPELTDLSLVEDLVLGKDLYACVTDIVAALKGKGKAA